MIEIGYYNGVMGPIEEINIPMRDRAIFFGDGVYDVTFAYNHKIFALDDHLDRFYRSLKMMRINFHLTREELSAEIQKCVDAASSDGPLIIYFQSSRGNCPRTHEFPDESIKPTLLIMITQAKQLKHDELMKLSECEDTRFLHCNIKTVNLIPNVMAAQKAKEEGCGEIVMHRGNQLTECAHSSLLLLKDGKLIAPVLNELILPSISRKHIFEIAQSLNIPTEARDVTMDEVYNADEVIVCSTTKLCVAANSINGVPVGLKDRDLFNKIQKTYMNRVEKEIGWKMY